MNYFFSVLDQFINIAGGFLITYILSQYWSIDALGAFNTTLSLIGIFGVLLGFGLNILIEKKGASINTRKLGFFFINRLVINLSLSIIISIWILSSEITDETRFVIFVSLAYGLLLRQFAIVQSARYAQLNVMSSVKLSVLLKALPVLILVVYISGIPKIVISTIGFTLIIALCKKYLDKSIFHLAVRSPKLFIPKKQNFSLMIDALLEVITRRIDLIISAAFLGLMETGIFAIILQFATIPWLVFVAINRLYLSTLRHKSKAEMKYQTRYLVIILLMFSIFCGIITYLTLDLQLLQNIEIFRVLNENYTTFVWLLFCYLFEAAYRIIRSNHISESNYSLVTYANLSIAVTKITLSLLLVSYMGILAFGISSVLAHVFPALILYKKIGWH